MKNPMILGKIFVIVGTFLIVFPTFIATNSPLINHRIVFVGLGVFFILMGFAAWILGQVRTTLEKKLRSHGLKGQAVIDFCQQGDFSANTPNPTVKLQLTISVEGKPPWKTEKIVTVPQLSIGRLTDKRPLVVYVDTINPDLFLVDWNA